MEDSPPAAAPGLGPAAEALLRLIDLLAADPTDDDLAAPLRDLERTDTAPEAAAAVQRATATARGIKRTLDQRRRREAELAALFDTAGDLAASRNLDAVLRAIVHRARTLLAADLSYIALHDPDQGDTYMRVTDGSVSARFQQLRLGMGEGLGGLVAETALPYASTDYQVDSRFRHTQLIDAAVEEEGVHGIVGVPLRLGDTVIGVLWAADRAPRAFAPDDIAMLVSLANHAAVAIESVRQLEATARTLRELSETALRSERLNLALRRAADAHDRLTGLVLSGGDVADLAAQAAELFGGAIGIFGADGEALARAGEGEVRFSAEGAADSQASRGAVLVDGRWVCAVMAGPEPLGSIVLAGRPGLGEADRQLFERSSLVTALLLLLRRSVADAEDRVRGELLDDLLSDPGKQRATSARLRAEKLGMDLRRRHAVLVLDGEAPAQGRLASEAQRHARAEGGLAGSRDGRTVLLLPGDDPGGRAAKLAADLGRATGRPVTVGASSSVDDIERLPEAYTAAVRCTDALIALGRKGEGGGMEQLGFIGVLLGESGTDAFVRRTIGPLLDYDAKRGTDLVGTLEAYFANGGHLAKTKAVLNVHLNTVSQRLERVASILGRDWNSPERSLEVRLALRVHRLSKP